jgi:4-hydroxy-tetrahydrodipicolinate reductase
MATRIVVCGAAGRMGQAIVRAAGAADGAVRLVGGVVRGGTAPAGYERTTGWEDAGELIRQADVLLDVSSPDATRALLERHADALRGRALIVGTTGLDGDTETALDALAAHAAVLVAANFSVGVNLLLALVEQAAAVLDAERFDVEIVEAHHRAKVDAPSGTALALARMVATARDTRLEAVRRDGRSGATGARPAGEIGIHALRGGDVAGEHRVSFLGPGERIEIAHAAGDRRIFAEGALRAAAWLSGRAAGRYTMRQVLGLESGRT